MLAELPSNQRKLTSGGYLSTLCDVLASLESAAAGSPARFAAQLHNTTHRWRSRLPGLWRLLSLQLLRHQQPVRRRSDASDDTSEAHADRLLGVIWHQRQARQHVPAYHRNCTGCTACCQHGMQHVEGCERQMSPERQLRGQ